jgi:hypothetical protein
VTIWSPVKRMLGAAVLVGGEQAGFMNLLSIGASIGVTVARFQWGWLGGLLGVKGGPIEAFIPVMLFAEPPAPGGARDPRTPDLDAPGLARAPAPPTWRSNRPAEPVPPADTRARAGVSAPAARNIAACRTSAGR